LVAFVSNQPRPAGTTGVDAIRVTTLSDQSQLHVRFWPISACRHSQFWVGPTHEQEEGLVNNHLMQCPLQCADRALNIVQIFDSEQPKAKDMDVGRLVALQRHSGRDLQVVVDKFLVLHGFPGKMFFGHLVDRLYFEFFGTMLVAHDTSKASFLGGTTKLGAISSFCANIDPLLSFQHRAYEIPLFCSALRIGVLEWHCDCSQHASLVRLESRRH
jgi:hypothetical protein